MEGSYSLPVTTTALRSIGNMAARVIFLVVSPSALLDHPPADIKQLGAIHVSGFIP